MSVIKIGTRKSQLALWQARHVAGLLEAAHPGIEIEFIKIVTEGDRFLDAPLAEAGGKGLFLKELEQALYGGQIDLAVHSMKDVTVTLPPGLHIGAILERHNVRDALVATGSIRLANLPAGAVVGTCSLRRQCLLAHHFPHLVIKNIRGNVNTRLAKLDAGEYDALILAAAGLERLEFDNRISEYLSEQVFVPAVGQGAIGIECRIDDSRINDLISALDHKLTRDCVSAERTVNARLGGGCHVPLAVNASAEGDELQMRAFAGTVDGKQVICDEHRGPISNPVLAGEQMADKLVAKGVMKVIEQVNEGT